MAKLKERIFSMDFLKRNITDQKHFQRKRKLPFSTLFIMILKMVKKSLSIECEWLENCPSKIPPSKQAFSKSRYKISHTGFKELFSISIDDFYKDDHSYGTWRGYRVIAADGSSVRLPNSKDISSTFGHYKRYMNDAKMPSLGRISLFVDLCTSFICSARLTNWEKGERSLASEQLVEVVEKMRSLQNDKLMFIYDRGYTSFSFMEEHKDLGVDFIFRLQRGTHKEIWRRIQNENDFMVTIRNRGTEKELKVRAVAIKLPKGETEVLLTSLSDRNFYSREDLGKAYKFRWQIEECYKRLKISEELENFSGIYVEAVLQEFWSHLLISNVLSAHMCDSQGPWDFDCLPRYRLNFNVLFGSLRVYLKPTILGDMSLEQFQALFKRVAHRAKVKIRPDRLYDRSKADKPKRHHVHRRVC